MKKNILIFGCIMSCVILVSLSYQPIIAEEKPIIKPKEEVISVESEDCECKDSPVRRFPILCQILLPIALLYKYLIQIYYDYNPHRILLQQYTMFKLMAESWGCWWIWWESQ